MMQELHGLVVCGGLSSRMGQDKSLMIYHSKPQWQHVAALLSDHCDKVSISCNARQSHQFNTEYSLLIDDPEYQDRGPMSALLTAFKTFPGDSFMVVGVDYPLLTSGDLNQLLKNREPGHSAVCMYHHDTEIEEPMVAYYNHGVREVLLAQFLSGDYSLRRLLKHVAAKVVLPLSPENIRSADTPESARQTIMSIK